MHKDVISWARPFTTNKDIQSLSLVMSDENQGESPVVAYVLATGTLLVAACFMCLCLMCCAKW